jgi:uncharacterized protein with GYD domain
LPRTPFGSAAILARRRRAVDKPHAEGKTRSATLKEDGMASYLLVTSYSADGAKGVLKNGGTARVDAAEKAIKSLGGKVQSFHFAFGADDAYVIVDLPDNIAAAALGLAVSSTGFTHVKTVVLLTPAEIDEAAKRQVTYTPPGGK